MNTNNPTSLDLYKELYLFNQLQKEIENSIIEIQEIFLKENSSLTIETLLLNKEYNKSIINIKDIYSKDLKYTIKNITEDELSFYMEYISKENNVNYFKYLVENGFEVNRNFCGDTLLSYIINGYNDFEPVEIVDYLLSSGGDVKIKIEDIDEMGNNTGYTSLLE